MSEEDQIIKINTEEEQPERVKKQKDPKKVAAGKALAKKNAEARKFFDESKTEVTEVTEVPPVTFSYVNNIFIKAAGVVTAGFALYHGWKFFSSKQKGLKFKRVEDLPKKVEELPKKRKSIDF